MRQQCIDEKDQRAPIPSFDHEKSREKYELGTESRIGTAWAGYPVILPKECGRAPEVGDGLAELAREKEKVEHCGEQGGKGDG